MLGYRSPYTPLGTPLGISTNDPFTPSSFQFSCSGVNASLVEMPRDVLDTEMVEILVTRSTRLVACLLNRPAGDRPVDGRKLAILTALDRPIDRQKLQHLDQILPRRTGKTAAYTTVRLRRLHYIDKMAIQSTLLHFNQMKKSQTL